eukprot:890169_1
MRRQRSSVALFSDLRSERGETGREDTLDFTSGCPLFQRVHITDSNVRTEETGKVCEGIIMSVELREKYVFRPRYYHPIESLEEMEILDVKRAKFPAKSKHDVKLVDGVFLASGDTLKPYKVHSVTEYYNDLQYMNRLISHGPTKSLAYNRLRIVESRFGLHILLNESNESREQRAVPHRDFYNIRKVDNHVHHSACMNQKHLLRFIKHKLKHEHATIIKVVDGKPISLKELFDELELEPYDISIDTLDMHAHQDTFHRFDKFNNKYNPIGSSLLREVFLKTDNYIKGRFLAEITREVFDDLEAQKYQHAEYRLSIYGRNELEWDKLASWICDHNLQSPNVMWLIQVPRLYMIYKNKGMIDNFEEMVTNIFKPLFEVTVDPRSHPKLHLFLKKVCGFDSVDDESLSDVAYSGEQPKDWQYKTNPPYSMWMYYLYANLYSLNKLRESRGMNTFAFRPHAGEAGSLEHLSSTFLLAQSINHGILLKKSPVLMYLYYLCQIGLSVSPLSNNILFVSHDKNPFPMFFNCGLNVTLSTDDPLMIHYTKDPLIEEYSVAAQVWKLSSVDMNAIARQSVIQSGFDHRVKEHWLGKNYYMRGQAGNDIQKTNLPDIRVTVRTELIEEELQFVAGVIQPSPTNAIRRSSEEAPSGVRLSVSLPGDQAVYEELQLASVSPMLQIPVRFPVSHTNAIHRPREEAPPGVRLSVSHPGDQAVYEELKFASVSPMLQAKRMTDPALSNLQLHNLDSPDAKTAKSEDSKTSGE